MELSPQEIEDKINIYGGVIAKYTSQEILGIPISELPLSTKEEMKILLKQYAIELYKLNLLNIEVGEVIKINYSQLAFFLKEDVAKIFNRYMSVYSIDTNILVNTINEEKELMERGKGIFQSILKEQKILLSEMNNFMNNFNFSS